MKTKPNQLDSILRHTTGRRTLGPLLGTLGFTPRLTRIPAAALPAYGLADEPGVRALTLAGEREAMTALLIELSSDCAPAETARIARRIRARNPVRPLFFLFAGPRYRKLGFASFGTKGELRQLIVDRTHPRRSDIETLEELAAREGEGTVELLHRHARALDRTRLTRQFFRDFRAQRDRIAAGWTGLPREATSERDQLALLLLCRLLFLYFLQRPGLLNGDHAYLPRLFERWRARPRQGSFYQGPLRHLFFGTLNTRPERRAPETAYLGELPYLNGGLFERHHLERAFPDLDLDDAICASILFDLLERYRFTTREAAESAADDAEEMGVDPEMLGRVFEELMAADRRESSGTFFTPANVVDRLVQGALEAWLQDDDAPSTQSSIARLVRYGTADDLDHAQRLDLAKRLESVRVLDPACGSGAFLLGALSRIARLRATLTGQTPATFRREVVGNSLYGVDLQEDAALLCALRLWLALTIAGQGATPDPLPNLDRKIRQGDALVDPIDLIHEPGHGNAHRFATTPGWNWNAASRDTAVRRALRAITPLAARYLSAEPDERPHLQRALASAELELARSWFDATARHLDSLIAELDAIADSRDLFGEPLPEAPLAATARRTLLARRRELAQLRETLDQSGTIPFFSFEIHFADPHRRGFDLILSNPPWVRAHHWPAGLGRLVRRRYAVCRHAGWRGGTKLAGTPAAAAGQVDLALLFLERSIRLLAPRGTLALLLPAKALRSLYGGGGRELLLRETRIHSIEDHSLDQRSIFRADAFAAAIIAQRPAATEQSAATTNGTHPYTAPLPATGTAAVTDSSRTDELDTADTHSTAPVRITMIRRGVPPLQFAIPADDLPILPGDLEAPWLLAPPDTRVAIRKMQRAGTPLGALPQLAVRRGIATGANDVFVITELQPKLGGITWIRTEGFRRARRNGRPAAELARFEGYVEDDVVRPLVRGSGIAAWRFQTPDHLIWLHDDTTAAPREAPPRTARFLARHDATLRARSGWTPATPIGSVFRASSATTCPKVAWQDLADDLKAVAIPARVRGPAGREVPVIPLNTVYFIPTSSYDEALRLAALLNSLPVRTFARAIAERAKDARFRFQAWTIALIPLPAGWDEGELGNELLELSRAAHEGGGLEQDDERRLDDVVASLYGLSTDDLHALRAFDLWLKGKA